MSAEMDMLLPESYGAVYHGVWRGCVWVWYWLVYDIKSIFPYKMPWLWRFWGRRGGWARVGIRGSANTSWIWGCGVDSYGDW